MGTRLSGTEAPIPTATQDEVQAVYVIMLDRFLSKYPDQWPISGMSDNPKTLEDQKQHDGNPALVPKRLYDMAEWNSKRKVTQMDQALPAPAAGRGAPPTNSMQVLALRGVLKLLLAPSPRSVSETGRMLGESMRLASQTAEKISILSMLPYFPSKESLEVAQAAVRDETVTNEAKVALAQVQEALKVK